MYYFVTERKNATRYYYIEVYAGSDKKQLEIIRDLADKKVKLIILQSHRYLAYTPIVTEHINKHYQIKETIGNKIILIRRNNDAA
jgi:predicted glycosyltransferase involved in capsule biosynthesis